MAPVTVTERRADLRVCPAPTNQKGTVMGRNVTLGIGTLIIIIIVVALIF